MRSWSRSLFWWSWSDRDHYLKKWSMIWSRSLFLVIEESDRQIIFRSIFGLILNLKQEISKNLKENWFKNILKSSEKRFWKHFKNYHKVIEIRSWSRSLFWWSWSDRDHFLKRWSVIWSRSLFEKVIGDQIEIMKKSDCS